MKTDRELLDSIVDKFHKVTSRIEAIEGKVASPWSDAPKLHRLLLDSQLIKLQADLAELQKEVGGMLWEHNHATYAEWEDEG